MAHLPCWAGDERGLRKARETRPRLSLMQQQQRYSLILADTRIVLVVVGRRPMPIMIIMMPMMMPIVMPILMPISTSITIKSKAQHGAMPVLMPSSMPIMLLILMSCSGMDAMRCPA